MIPRSRVELFAGLARGLRVAILPFLIVLAATASADGNRIRVRMDEGWRFRQDPPSTVSMMSPFTWTWRTAQVKNLDVAGLPDDFGNGRWIEARIGRDVFQNRPGFAWFETDLGGDARNRTKSIHFESVDDNVVVFLNGKRLLRHDGWNDPFDVPLAPAWKNGGPNTLVLLVENTGGGGGIMGSVNFAAGPQAGLPREAVPDYGDAAWRKVHLPHDYVVEGNFDPRADAGHGSLPVVAAWYRKTFDLPAAYRGKSVWMDFDGVYRKSTFWLNGHLLGAHAGGYDGFRFALNRWANFGGSNTLAVRVDPRQPEGWWYEGGGIYRHVWLNVADPVHVTPWGVFVKAGYTEGGAAHPATVSVETSIDNTYDRDQRIRVMTNVLDETGAIVAAGSAEVRVAAGGQAVARGALHFADAKLWSIENPYLYRLVTTVVRGGAKVDQVETPFGVRNIRFDANAGFFLNGKHVEIQGTCNHQDHAGVGIAVPDELFYWRVRRLKEMGSNAYRCSHNPPAQELLDACDRLGMIVMDESRHLGDTENPKSSESTRYSDLSELKSMLLRDRNHPSIVMWSMCNEEGIQGTAAGARIFAAMRDVTNRLDGSRPVTCAMNGGWGSGISLVEDLQGINYGIGAYDRHHARFPNQPMYGSETASALSTRGIYANDPVRGYVSAYDVNRPGWGATAEGAWKPIIERPFMAGGYVWTGFDYKGEPTPYEWPCINSHFGIMDICGFPKDTYYYYQAWWGDKPVVHILPHWNWPGKEGQPISVWCHSNADQVELFLNGTSLGKKDMPRYGHLEWSVPYVPGELVARGYRDGKEIASDRVVTTGAPAQLRLKTDRRTVLADGEDVTEVQVEVLDASGHVVPDASNLLGFSVVGLATVVGVGNGDPSSHEPDKATERHAFNGLAMALIGDATRPGPVTLTVYSSGLASASLQITCKRP